MRTILTIGIIPEDNNQDQIMIGDPTMSGTAETDFEIVDDVLTGIDTEFRCDARGMDWFDVSSPIFTNLANAVTAALGKPLDSVLLAHAWALFQWELEVDVPELVMVCEENDGGEFENPNQQHNGCFYIRHVVEEDDQIVGEQAVVVHS